MPQLVHESRKSEAVITPGPERTVFRIPCKHLFRRSRRYRTHRCTGPVSKNHHRFLPRVLHRAPRQRQARPRTGNSKAPAAIRPLCIAGRQPIRHLENRLRTALSFIRLDDLRHYSLIEFEVNRVLIVGHELPARVVCPDYLMSGVRLTMVGSPVSCAPGPRSWI